MAEAYLSCNERYKQLGVIGGAVAVAAVLRLDPTGEDGAGARGGDIYCANVGDARAVLCRDGKGVRLSRDFKPFDEDEYDRVVALGGFVSLRDGGRVCDDLALTRALGDLHLAKFVEPRPHFRAERLDDFAQCPFFIIGCDGVWDVLTDQMAVDAVLSLAPHHYTKGAAALRDLAFLHGSTDNISAMVVDLSAIWPARV